MTTARMFVSARLAFPSPRVLIVYPVVKAAVWSRRCFCKAICLLLVLSAMLFCMFGSSSDSCRRRCGQKNMRLKFTHVGVFVPSIPLRRENSSSGKKSQDVRGHKQPQKTKTETPPLDLLHGYIYLPRALSSRRYCSVFTLACCWERERVDSIKRFFPSE